MKIPLLRLVAAVVAVVFWASSCATVQTLELRPMALSQPVSASAFTLGPDMNVYGPEQYLVIRDFEFEKVYAGKQNATVHQVLDLDGELADLLAESGADGIVQLKLVPRKRDMGMTIVSGGLWTAATFMGMIWLGMTIMNGSLDYDARVNIYETPMYISGALTAILAGAGYAVSHLRNPSLSVLISGKLVSFR